MGNEIKTFIQKIINSRLTIRDNQSEDRNIY